MDWRRRYTSKQRSRGGFNKPRREERFEEIRARFFDDRKGFVIASGIYAMNGRVFDYVLRHSVSHAQKFDLLLNGRLYCCCGVRRLPSPWMRRRARIAREENTTYKAIELAPNLGHPTQGPLKSRKSELMRNT